MQAEERGRQGDGGLIGGDGGILEPMGEVIGDDAQRDRREDQQRGKPVEPFGNGTIGGV